MAYDEFLADRVRQAFTRKKANFIEKKMIGGLCFMVDDKMCCGIHIDKKYGDSLLMARIGLEKADQVMGEENVLPMDFTGRPMKGYVFVEPGGFDMDEDLDKWIQYCLEFNPLAKSSKRRKK
jgi:hypothetical protein